MSDSQPKGEPGEISRFRAVVVAALRAEQLRRGSKPRIELDGKRHKDTSIAMEEVRRGLITFTQFARPNVQDPATSNLQVGVEPFLPAIR
jgi:DNA-directed RNA polymerase omega subunit